MSCAAKQRKPTSAQVNRSFATDFLHAGLETALCVALGTTAIATRKRKN